MTKINTDTLKTSLVSTAGSLLRSGEGFDERLGELLFAVQQGRVYDDGKTFLDLVPARRLKSIREEYELLKGDPTFDLRDFVSRHFYDAATGIYEREYATNPAHSPLEHIEHLWAFLERRNRVPRASLLPLPHKYIVPGGRFNEQFYWDSYFIMLGLASGGRWDRVEGMIKNCAFQLRKYGYIPTANRSYLLSRSQPPFFSHMVRLLASHRGKRVLREYLPALLTEYRFWMRGKSKVADTEHRAYRRVVQMPNGAFLNRYYDNKKTPRPESYREDVTTAAAAGGREQERLYLHIRAAAESGWDFSSRWFLDPQDIHTIHTADIIPVDLNSLLYHLELTIADAYKASMNVVRARQYRNRAKARQQAIELYLWDEEGGMYRDYNFHHRVHTPTESLAGVFPLFVGLTGPDRAARVAHALHARFLKKGGLVTTAVSNGQQWDAPNGWAPLQWVAIEGLRVYGHHGLADAIRGRWLELNDAVFAASGKFVEKYNVVGDGGPGGGGEYTLQDGFGWTNGVYEALSRNFRPGNR